MSDIDNGWSSEVLPPGGERGCSLREGKDFRPRDIEPEWGVDSELTDGEASLIDSSSSDGIDSLDIVLVDKIDSRPFSLPTVSSSSSGGLRRKSSGLFPSDIDNSFSVTPVCRRILSSVSLCPAPFRFLPLQLFCKGMDVIARSAATEGGKASGECIVRARRPESSECRFPVCLSFLD